MYFLDHVTPVDVPYGLLNYAAGYAPNYPHYGFSVLDEARATRVFEVVGPAGLPQLLSPSFGIRGQRRVRAPSDRIGDPYTPADERTTVEAREAVEVDPHEIERGLRAHARTQNHLAEVVSALGATRLRPRAGGPDFDLAWEFEGRVLLLFCGLTRVGKASTDGSPRKG